MQNLYNYDNLETYNLSLPNNSPNVSYVLASKQIKYENDEEFKLKYFTILSLEDNNEISFIQGTQTTSVVIEVSTDNGSTWVSKSTAASTTTSVVTLNKNQTAIFRGNNNQLGFNYQATGMRISGSKNFEVFGNLLSLVYKDFIGKLNAPTYNYVFSNLFNGNTKLISAENLILPNPKAFGCFYATFSNCTNLKYSPKILCETKTLSASTAYANMFNGCTNMLTTPILTPTTISGSCYDSMFKNCTHISSIECHATSMQSNSLNNWMSGVTQSGIFYQQSSITYNTGVSGIPENWQIKYLDINYVTDGLIFWLDGINKGSSGNSWKDIIGGIVFAGTDVTSTEYGWSFNGTSSYFLSDSILTGTADYTVEVCFKPNNTNTYCLFMCNKNTQNNVLFYKSGNNITFSQYNNTYPLTLSANQKYSVSLNLDNGLLNGTSVSKNSGTDYWSGTNNFYIGRRSAGAYFSGEIYSIRIYDRKLSQNEQLANFNIDNNRFNLGL